MNNFVSPSSKLKTEAERRRARLLAILIIPFFINALIGAIVTPEPVSSALWLLSILLVVAFILSRTRWSSWGASIAIIAASVPSFAAVIQLSEYNSLFVWKSMAWLAVPVLLASIWLPVRQAIIVFSLLMGAMFVLPMTIDQLHMQHMAASLIMLSIAVLLALIGTSLTQRDQQNLEQKTKESLRHQAFLSTVLDNIADGVIVFDTEGNISSVNETSKKLLRSKSDALLKSDIYTLFPYIEKELRDFCNHALVGNITEKKFWDNIKCERFRGDNFYANLNVRVISVENELYILAIVHDLTESRKLDMMKNDFVSSVSHELRTPLTSINGALGLIQGLFKDQLNEDSSKLFNIAQKNCTLLIQLVNDILDMSRLESNIMDFKFEQLDLVKLIHQTIEENMPFARNNMVKLELVTTDESFLIDTDPTRIRQVINNLLSNAIKYSPRGDTVTISLSVTPESYRISVTDNGPGIPESFQKNIFQKFSRADSSDQRKYYGTGLGLSISKEIVSQMGGVIDFETTQGYGSNFFFEIPRSIENK